jgi:hypothetical protein
VLPPNIGARKCYTGFMGPEEFVICEVDSDEDEVFLEYEDGECEALFLEEFNDNIEEGLISKVSP